MIDRSSMLNNALFQIHILQLWLCQILGWIGRRVFNPVEAHMWSYFTSSKYLSVRGRVLLSGDHKTKHSSRLIPKVDMRASLSTTVPRISDIAWKTRTKSHSVTNWLKLSFFNKTIETWLRIPSSKRFALHSVICRFVWNCRISTTSANHYLPLLKSVHAYV